MESIYKKTLYKTAIVCTDDHPDFTKGEIVAVKYFTEAKNFLPNRIESVFLVKKQGEELFSHSLYERCLNNFVL